MVCPKKTRGDILKIAILTGGAPPSRKVRMLMGITGNGQWKWLEWLEWLEAEEFSRSKSKDQLSERKAWLRISVVLDLAHLSIEAFQPIYQAKSPGKKERSKAPDKAEIFEYC
jgi:hypothetical protein